MLLKWPEKAIGAIQKLFEQLQDIDVYIEDTGLEPLYLELLKRIKTEDIRLARVFAIGSRSMVVEAARQHDFTSRRAIFIIDGDFEWVRGDAAPSVPGVFRLDAYCIENLLISKPAAVRVLMECAECDIETAIVSLEFDRWLSNVRCLVELFKVWTVLNAILPEIKTVSSGVGCVLDAANKVAVLAKTKVDQRIAEAKEELSRCCSPDLSLIEKQVTDRFALLDDPIDVISGKDFLLPLLRFHLHERTRDAPRISQLRFRLAMNPNVNRFRKVSVALRKAARGRNIHF